MSQSLILTRLEHASRAVAECKDLTTALVGAADMGALVDWAKHRGLSQEIINGGQEMHLRFQRNAGEHLAGLKRGNPGQPKKNTPNVGGILSPYRETLERESVTTQDAGRMEKLASMPSEQFEYEIATVKAKRGELTTAHMLKLVKRDDLEVKKKRNLTSYRAGLIETPTVYDEDYFDLEGRLDDQSVDLLLTDPPYMTDVDDDIDRFSTWVNLWLPKVKPTGRAFICTGAYPEEMSAYITTFNENWPAFELDNPLIWTYRNTMGPTPKRRFKLNYQVIWHLYGKDAGPLNSDVLNDLWSVIDISAPDGRHGTRFHKWQKPDELARLLIRLGTNEGDLVVDPFCGSGTFLVAAGTMGRKSIGSDIDPEALEITRERGCNVIRAR